MECLRLSSDGSGVGYTNGLVTFVPGLLPGEAGEIQVVERKARYQKARLIKLLNPSRFRRDPPCSVYEVCGGCHLQHLSYAEALVWKRQWVADALQRIGKINVQVNPVLGMDHPWRYRNKARLHRDETGRLGYYREKSNDTIVFKDCLLLSEAMNGWVRALEEILRKESLPVKNIVFRQTMKNEGLVCFEGVPDSKGISRLKRELDTVHSAVKREKMKELHPLKEPGPEAVEPQGLEGIQSVYGLDPSGLAVHLWGGEGMEVSLQGLSFRVSPSAFLQVNPVMTEKLYALVLNWAGLTGGELVWDLYCGIGTLTLALARRAQRVIGIEENRFAVEDAKRNSQINKVKNVEFLTGRVEDLLTGVIEGSTEKPDLVVLDPPRAGVQPEVVDALLQVKPKSIIYVSCVPATLARDAGRLAQEGYQVKQVQPVDMFPQTGHVETVVWLDTCPNFNYSGMMPILRDKK